MSHAAQTKFAPCGLRKAKAVKVLIDNTEQLDSRAATGYIWNLETMKRIIMKKKEYISPVAEILEIGALSVLALSKTDEQVDDDGQLAPEHRGDWENIWGAL